jgi:hypothetical protein
MAGRGCSCGPGHLNEDNARFLLLAVLIVLYLLGGAAVFSALELAHERQAKQRWEERLANFSRGHNLSREELRGFLRHYEEATRAGIRVDNVRPRWDFTGAFYFVGTVVSTIGKRIGGSPWGWGGSTSPTGPGSGISQTFLHPPGYLVPRSLHQMSHLLPDPTGASASLQLSTWST